ncbi:uncharacterized protein LOC106658600 [Trichogramma pretiosum]|uniref:uncharacterized protein LOC106658600 n=1 Tax=Trichogramma pretiosum TaxID=7493 RepID=UPI0006C9B68B|nr:uncharacterized protein LOC106658600 [Trichogramma pretiosum]
MMETKTQVKVEPQETTTTNNATDAEAQKRENNNSPEGSPPAKKECLAKNKSPSNPPASETTILQPPPPPPPAQINIFFELFYDGPYDLTLSNRSWGIHRVPPPNRAIVLSEITFALFNVAISPSYKKQVILTDHLKFKAFVLDKLVVEKTLDGENTQEDFEQSFAEIVNMVVCKGGPIIEDNQDVLSRCAFKDFYSNRWRHKSCTIIIERGEEVCRPCSYLDKYFQEWMKYNSKEIIISN